jgi:hypothetical protein
MAGNRGAELALCMQLMRGSHLQSGGVREVVKRVQDMSHAVNIDLLEALAVDVQNLSYDLVFKQKVFEAQVSVFL